MTSALLFVALLIVVDLSYRRWIRHSIVRARKRRARPEILDLAKAENRPQPATGADATVIALAPRAEASRLPRRSG